MGTAKGRKKMPVPGPGSGPNTAVPSEYPLLVIATMSATSDAAVSAVSRSVATMPGRAARPVAAQNRVALIHMTVPRASELSPDAHLQCRRASPEEASTNGIVLAHASGFCSPNKNARSS